MLKKVAIGIGIVAALLLLAGVAAALLVDVNRYKPTLERMVTDATGRKLTIDGRLSLQMFPRLGVALPKSTLSGPGGNGAFASLSSASVAVAWLPLLTGRIVVDQVNCERLAGSARAPSRRPQQHRRSAAASKGCAQGVERQRIERDQRVDSRHFPERRESVAAFCRRQHDRRCRS